MTGERPVGWYLDPDRPRRHRYWDGDRWWRWRPADEGGCEPGDAAPGAPADDR